jgi:hypothetical protein
MQHPDEGTIHSWLDGALAADEAARVEAHVKECPRCASAVAEARGFIAASSRILTSLDNVPKGVVPLAPPTRMRNWPVWRAAAAVLVVALGSFVVLRDRIAAPARPISAKTIVSDAATPTSMAATPPAAASEQAAADASVRNAAPLRRVEGSEKPVATPAPRAINLERNQSSGIQRAAPTGAAPQFRKAAQVPANGREDVPDNVRAPSGGSALGAAAPFSPLSSQVPGVAAMNAASEPQPIRVVGRPRVIGQIQTLYEVAPGDTVLFAEMSNLTLESVVVTGATAVTAAAGVSSNGGTRLRPQAKASVPADNRRKPEPTAAAPAGPPAAPSVQTSNGITTLSWKDPATGNAMKLSGRHNLVDLLEIKRRIEQARAAEAAKKKP